MPLITLFAFLFLIASFVSLWVRKDSKIWGSFLALSIVAGLIAGLINEIGVVFIFLLGFLWFIYTKKPITAFFLVIIGLSTALKMHFLPGYSPFFFASKFAIGLEGSLIGLFPLALLVPLNKDWAVLKGLLIGCLGIGVLAALATISGATHWQIKWPNLISVRLISNFFLTCIPEEGFYRGFVQSTLCKYFKNVKLGKILALLLTSILFTATHAYWSPNIQILLFVFLASLLYGGVYLISGRIESAILCHFLLNFIHMTFFSYHLITK